VAEPTDILNLERIDAAPIQDEKFSHQFENWLSTLVDTINTDLDKLQNTFITGTVTLAAGTATVFTDLINTGDNIFLNLTNNVSAGIITTSINDEVSFTLSSSSGADASTYSYMIVKI